jgi:all-trans-8'-apo-beta-carotenal 15,15'-oxygenase
MSATSTPRASVTHDVKCSEMTHARRRARCRAASTSGSTDKAFEYAPNTLGWGVKRGAIDPRAGAELLANPNTHGYCVYSHADWAHAYVTADGEHDYACEASAESGSAPEELRGGTLYRIGPGLFKRGGKDYAHMLDGDGLALRFAFDESGKSMRFTSQFVRTEEFRKEEASDSVLYRGTFGTMRDGGVPANWFDLHTKNLANTNIISWGGRVLALYEAGQPISLDGDTLKSSGVDSLEGRLEPGEYFTLGLPEPIGSIIERSSGLGGRAFTAHPHIDPNTGFLCGWGWRSRVTQKAVEISLWEWDKDWNERGRRDYVMEGCEAAPHDFGVTAKWYVMIQNRLGIDPLPFLAGVKGAGECLISQPEEPLLVHLIPRSTALSSTSTAPSPVVATGPKESFEIHVAFAHDGRALCRGEENEDEDEWVTAYTAGWDKLSPGVFLGEWGSSDPWPFEVPTKLTPDFNNIPRTLLWMYEINATTGEVKRQPAPGCEDLCIDHPHVSPLYEGKRECRYVYASLSNEMRVSGPPLGYVRIDLKTGELQKWYASNRSFCEEPVIVPKKNGVNEDDAWLLGLIADHSVENESGVSRLVVLDCANLSAGPVAQFPLQNRIPHGLHGMFQPARGA